jgi:bacterioferritin (cytochrome b1)
MFLWSTLQKNWTYLLKFLNRLVKSVPHDGRQKLLHILYREYVEEMEGMLQFQRHAERMHYPQFREKLLRIAKEEQKHAQWLAGRIIALGGHVPYISFTPEEGLNSWGRLRLDLDEEKRCISDLTERMAIVERLDPETAKVLRHILEEEKNHRETIIDMLMRSDPQAMWPV